MQIPFGVQLASYDQPSKSAEDFASFHSEISTFIADMLMIVKNDPTWQWPYGMFFFQAKNGITLLLTSEKSGAAKIDIAQTQSVVDILKEWAGSGPRSGPVPSVGEVAVWSDGWKELLSQGRLSMVPVVDEGGSVATNGGKIVPTMGQLTNKTQRAWFRHFIDQSVDSADNHNLRLPSLSVPQDGWKRAEGDFELTMTQYTEPKGDPIVLNFYFIPHMVTWVLSVMSSGGGEKSMDDEWPDDIPVSHTFATFRFELEPVERQPPVKFTVGEVIDAMNLFQAWSFAWSGGDARSVPSASLTVRSVEWGEILARGTFRCMANGGGTIAVN